MSNYFSFFPKTPYDISKGGSSKDVVNIMLRFITKLQLQDRTAVFYNYTIQDGDRPDIIAAKYYGDAKYDWIVMLTNNIFNVDYDWPLSSIDFESFIRSKYGSFAASQQQVHHYEKIIREDTTNTLGEYVKEKTIQVDLETYTNTLPSLRKSVSAYDYEVDLNESKRNIRILDSKYLSRVVEEAERVLENG